MNPATHPAGASPSVLKIKATKGIGIRIGVLCTTKIDLNNQSAGWVHSMGRGGGAGVVGMRDLLHLKYFHPLNSA